MLENGLSADKEKIRKDERQLSATKGFHGWSQN